jgi:hypothetical protein
MSYVLCPMPNLSLIYLPVRIAHTHTHTHTKQGTILSYPMTRQGLTNALRFVLFVAECRHLLSGYDISDGNHALYRHCSFAGEMAVVPEEGAVADGFARH